MSDERRPESIDGEPPSEPPVAERGHALHHETDDSPPSTPDGRRELAEDIESGGP